MFGKKRHMNRNTNTRRAYNRGGSNGNPASPKKSPSPPTDYDDAELELLDDADGNIRSQQSLAVARPRQKYTTTSAQKRVDMFRDVMLKRSGTGPEILPSSRRGVLSRSSLARRVMHNFITGSTGSRRPAYPKKLISGMEKTQQELLVNVFRTNYMPIVTGFNAPQSIAIDRHGNLVVADTVNNRVCVYNPITGDILRTVNMFDNPYSVTFVFDETGIKDELVVADMTGVFLVNYANGQAIRNIYMYILHTQQRVNDVIYDGAIQLRFRGETAYYTKSGKKVVGNTVKIPGLGPMAYCTKKKFKDNESIIVADSEKGHLYESNFGEVFPILKLGTGTGWGQFKGIGGIAVDCVGNVIVTDKGNHRVHIFNPDFTKARIIGKRGDAYGDFNNPTGVAVDCRGNIFVCDTGNNRIQVIRYTSL